MAYTTDKEIDLTARNTGNYIISSQHRRTGNENKSIWSLTYNDEVECFIQAMNGNWKEETEAWGIKVINNTLQVVGHTNNYTHELKLAKFVDGSNTNVWHGYPADYLRKVHDIPKEKILKDWVEKGFLTKAKMCKIRLGQACNL